eukprot:CAMPEP_0174952328 /NCGR_PEP_ID=MMETSP1355-20121228/95306_1 /TAXON_ID=464990 /ORGANISM="Hemiselmis tepida, Strain CCMP443" /LENGTH=153 /DNA_ID=CAMNT_0016200019 /DNA_START=682 /DNA_END=1141 /DNA_ORIENTATION=+
MLGTIVLFPVLPVLPVLVLRVLLARGLILIAGIAIALFFPCLIVLFILPVAILVILIVVGRGSGAAGLLPELGPGAPFPLEGVSAKAPAVASDKRATRHAHVSQLLRTIAPVCVEVAVGPQGLGQGVQNGKFSGQQECDLGCVTGGLGARLFL